jgi:TRAP-type mannitol/chloroaromatic compound transport system substrate-binding protein
MKTTSLVAAAAAAALAWPSGAQAQETINLTFQSAYPSGDPQFQHFAWWAERIGQFSGGRLVIETLPAGAIVPAFEVLDATHDRIIDGAHAWSGFWVGKDRAAVMVSSGPAGPFGMDWSDVWGWYYQGDGIETVEWFFQDHLGLDVVWRPLLSSGAQPLGWFNREIESAEDMQGLRLRIPGIPGEMYEGMGVSVVTLPGGEIVPAGERGVIDAAEFVGPWIDYALGFQDIWQIYYAPAYHEVVTVAEILINQEVWNDLPEDLRGIVELVTESSMLWWEQKQQMNDRLTVDRLVEEGVQFRRTPDDVLERSLEIWHQILEQEYTTNEAFKRLVDSQLAWASNVVLGKRILEPDFKALADIYWGPGGFVAQADFLDFEYEVPDYYDVFIAE